MGETVITLENTCSIITDFNNIFKNLDSGKLFAEAAEFSFQHRHAAATVAQLGQEGVSEERVKLFISYRSHNLQTKKQENKQMYLSINQEPTFTQWSEGKAEQTKKAPHLSNAQNKWFNPSIRSKPPWTYPN